MPRSTNLSVATMGIDIGNCNARPDHTFGSRTGQLQWACKRQGAAAGDKFVPGRDVPSRASCGDQGSEYHAAMLVSKALIYATVKRASHLASNLTMFGQLRRVHCVCLEI